MPRGLNRTEEERAWSVGVQEEVTREERGGRWRIGGNGEDDTKGDTTGKGPHNNNTSFRTPPSFIKDRMAKGDRKRPSVVDLGTPILTVGELRAQFWIPLIKGRKERGVWNEASTIDLGTPILAAQIHAPFKSNAPKFH